jgi:hypothetical protein
MRISYLANRIPSLEPPDVQPEDSVCKMLMDMWKTFPKQDIGKGRIFYAYTNQPCHASGPRSCHTRLAGIE